MKQQVDALACCGVKSARGIEGRGKMAAVKSTGELILVMTACVGALCDGWDMMMMMMMMVVVVVMMMMMMGWWWWWWWW
jgi:hypothetical protein